MPTPYFLEHALVADYQRDLQAPSLRLSNAQLERFTTLTLANPSVELSVHHVQLASEHPLPCTLSGALVLRENDAADTTLYLHTPWAGLEVFKDPGALAAALGARHGDAERFYQVLLEGPLFQVRMQRIFQARWERLARFWQQWLQQPQVSAAAEPASAQHAWRTFWATPGDTGVTRRLQLASLLGEAYQHTVLQALHEQLLEPEEAAWLKQAPSADAAWTLALLTDTGPSLRLPGACVLQAGAGKPWFLYLAVSGLQLFADREALLAWLTSTAGQAMTDRCLSAAQRTTLASMQQPALRLVKPEQGLFLDRADSLIALQQRNLSDALAQPGANDSSVASALDIVGLIDPALASYAAVQPAPLPPLSLPLPLVEQPQALQLRLQQIDTQRLDLQGYAALHLDQGLAAISAGLPPASTLTLRSTSDAKAPQTTLPDALLERFTGAAGSAPTDLLQTLPDLPSALASALLKHAAAGFEPGYQGLLSMQLQAGAAAMREWRKQLLTLELALQRDLGEVDRGLLTWLDQALSYPDVRTREVAAAPLCEIFALAVSTDPAHDATELNDTFALGVIAADPPQVLMWSCIHGLKAYASWQALFDAVRAGFSGTERWRWLQLLGPAQRPHVAAHMAKTGARPLQIGTREVSQDFLTDLDRRDRQRRIEAAAQVWPRARLARLPASQLDAGMAQATANPALVTRLERLTSELQAAALTKALPDWLRKASVAQRREYATALELLHRTTEHIPDYRAGIEPLAAFARQRILERLHKVQPVDTPDPDLVRIDLPEYTPTPPWLFGHEGLIPEGIPASATMHYDSLTAYAISHFSRSQTAVLRARMADGSPVPSWMTPMQLHQLVDPLDVGGQYRQLLASKLSKTASDYAERCRRFALHSYAQLRVAALQARLCGELGSHGLACVEALLSMPDGLARRPLDGQSITLRPMRLVPAPGMASDRVEGLYLIGPTPGTGPVVLYAAAGSAFVFREFADEAALLGAAQAKGALQDLIVQQVDDAVRSRYSHGGLKAAHLPTDSADLYDLPLPSAAPTLDPTVYAGNAWHLLFDDRVQWIQQLATAQTVSAAEARWESFKFLTGLGVEQVSFMAEGRLAGLLATWAGVDTLQAAVKATERHQWAQALGRLAYALFLLAPQAATALAFDDPQRYLAEDPLLQADLRQLQATVAMADLQRQPADGLYLGASGARYAPVAGQVYPVCELDGQTRIGSQEQPGPVLTSTLEGQWQLERLWDLRYGGGQSRRRAPASATLAVTNLISIKATGMAAIRTLSRHKAECIGQARAYAKERLEIALDNLGDHQPGQGLTAAGQQILSEFFGVGTPSSRLIDDVKYSISQVYQELLDPTLSAWNSSRFVFGTHLPDSTERIMAMVAKDDPERRIFLTDLFFELPSRLRYHHKRLLAPFDLPNHLRATTLTHELSHMVHDSEDIAYLEPGVPYLDLIDPNAALDPNFKAEITALQRGLSHHTPPAHLFAQRVLGTWTPLDVLDPDAAARVLSETGCQNLEQAREVFYTDADKRAAVILANADSVALLVMLLGRQPCPAP